MNKTKCGFTLVELLAVIVILAVIATITVVITGKVVKNSKASLLDRQKQTIEEAARNYYLKEGMNEILNSEESCVNLSTLLNKGYLETEKVINPLTKEDMNGSVFITYSSNNYNYKYQDTTCPYLNGMPVYFNVDTGEKCDNYTEAQSNIGVNSGCMKFYAFNDDGGNKVNLILDHNTTAVVAWNSTEENTNGPKELLEQLKTDTKLWQGTEAPSNYTMDQSTQGSGAKYTIDYSEYKARLITAGEIAKITGNTSWNEVTTFGGYYFDSNTDTQNEACTNGNTNGCKYGWLYDRTSVDCVTYGCLNNSSGETKGYWTSSSDALDVDLAWSVTSESTLQWHYVVNSNPFGVRPVIEVLKSKLK